MEAYSCQTISFLTNMIRFEIAHEYTNHLRQSDIIFCLKVISTIHRQRSNRFNQYSLLIYFLNVTNIGFFFFCFRRRFKVVMSDEVVEFDYSTCLDETIINESIFQGNSCFRVCLKR